MVGILNTCVFLISNSFVWLPAHPDKTCTQRIRHRHHNYTFQFSDRKRNTWEIWITNFPQPHTRCVAPCSTTGVLDPLPYAVQNNDSLMFDPQWQTGEWHSIKCASLLYKRGTLLHYGISTEYRYSHDIHLAFKRLLKVTNSDTGSKT